MKLHLELNGSAGVDRPTVTRSGDCASTMAIDVQSVSDQVVAAPLIETPALSALYL
jgi:hypothetical protein